MQQIRNPRAVVPFRPFVALIVTFRRPRFADRSPCAVCESISRVFALRPCRSAHFHDAAQSPYSAPPNNVSGDHIVSLIRAISRHNIENSIVPRTVVAHSPTSAVRRDTISSIRERSKPALARHSSSIPLLLSRSFCPFLSRTFSDLANVYYTFARIHV